MNIEMQAKAGYSRRLQTNWMQAVSRQAFGL